MYEMMTFRLASGVDELTFRTVDERVQVGFAYQQPGFIRRTLGRRDDRWLVLAVWESVEAADAAQAAFDATGLVAGNHHQGQGSHARRVWAARPRRSIDLRHARPLVPSIGALRFALATSAECQL